MVYPKCLFFRYCNSYIRLYSIVPCKFIALNLLFYAFFLDCYLNSYCFSNCFNKRNSTLKQGYKVFTIGKKNSPFS